MIKICEICNSQFECKHDTTCWCTKYKIEQTILETLKTKFKDCICEDCLKKIIDKE